VLKDAVVATNMNGKGAWRDNVFIKRLWRTVKYEKVYLRVFPASLRPGHRSAVIFASTKGRRRIRRWTGGRLTKPISTD
jgi:hypothetical protein